MGTKHTLLAGALLAAALCLFAPAVGAEDTKTVGILSDDGYTVTIPSTVAFAEGDTKQTLTISGTLGKYRTLDVTVASKNDYALKYASEPNNSSLPSLSYTLKSADTTQNFDSGTTGKNTLSYITDATERNPISTTLKAEIQTPLSTATMSGSYTDNLTFTFDCKKRTQECEITVSYESMDTTATGEITNRIRDSKWESEKYTFTKTLDLGEEYTFGLEELFDKNSSVTYAVKSKDDTENKNAWETEMLDPDTHTYKARTYSITPELNRAEGSKYTIEVYRKLAWLDLNYFIYDAYYEENNETTPYHEIDYGGDHRAGSTTFTLNDAKSETIADHWIMHPYGSTFEMSNMKNGGTSGTAYPNYEVYGYWIRRGEPFITDDKDNIVTFGATDTKSTGKQLIDSTYRYTTKNSNYLGDYVESVYIILRPYTVKIKYETMASTKAISSGSTHKRHSDFPETGNEVIKGIAWDADGTYTWTNKKYTDETNYWKDAEYTITKEYDTDGYTEYDYTIEVLRKMYALDLNVALRTPNGSGGYTYKTFGSKNANDEEVSNVASWGQIDIKVNNKSVATGTHDHFTGYPYGSTFNFSDLDVYSPYEIVGYTLNKANNELHSYDYEITGTLDYKTAEHNVTINIDTEVTDQVIVWIIVERNTTSDEIIGDDEIITPATTTPTTPATDDTIASDTDDVTDDDSAADTDDTPTTPGDDDDIAPDDTGDTTDTSSDADAADDADTDTDDTEPADDPTDEPDTDDGDVEDTDTGNDVLDDETDDVDADTETAPEPLDILA